MIIASTQFIGPSLIPKWSRLLNSVWSKKYYIIQKYNVYGSKPPRSMLSLHATTACVC